MKRGSTTESRTELRIAIGNIVGRWAGLLRYFPQDEPGKRAVMEFLDRIIVGPEQLAWVDHAMVNVVGEWQGSKELRGVLCWRYTARDGIEATSGHPAFASEMQPDVVPLPPIRGQQLRRLT